MGDAYFNEPVALAMHKCAYYECYECKVPYFGGMIDCAEEL